MEKSLGFVTKTAVQALQPTEVGLSGVAQLSIMAAAINLPLAPASLESRGQVRRRPLHCTSSQAGAHRGLD